MMTNLLSSAFVARTTQLLSSVARLRLLLVMFLTLTVSANAWGADVTCDFTAQSASHSSYTDSWSYGDFTVFGGANNNGGWAYVKMGGKSSNLANANPVYIASPQMTSSISKVQVSIIAGSLAKSGMSVNDWGVYVYSDANMTNQVDYVAGGEINNSAAVFEFTPTSGTTWSANNYYKVSFDLANTSTTNGIICLDKITFVESTGGGGDPDPDPVDPEVTFSNGEYTIGGAALDLSTLWDSNSTGAVTYSVTNAGTTGATVNGTSFTATAAGTCTVQASQAATATHNAATATATITVTAPSGGGEECTWTLITNASDLNAGDKVVIAAKDYNYAISTTQNGNNRGQASITKNTSNNTITFGDDVQILTLEEGTESGTLAFNTGVGYLYAASSSKNYMRTETTLSDNSSWEITIADDGTATVVAQGTNTRNTMQYNQSSSIFSCYGSASQKAIVIYKEVCTGGSTETLLSVTYNGNGNTSGSVPNDTNSPYKENAEVTVLGNTGNLAKTGCTFSGWNTQADGFGTNYAAGATFTITENTTLYAQWTAYTVTWTINPTAGGSLSATSGNSTTVSPDAAYTYGTPAYTVTSGTATVSQNGNTFTAVPTANCTIQINMVEKPKWTVTFHAGEHGTCATASLTETTAGAGVELPDVTPNDGYRFIGWATTSGATTANAGTAGETYKPESNITLYAVYKQLHTITWMVGSNSVLTEEVANATGVTQTPDDPANGAIGECANAFMGWSEKSAGSTPQDEAYYDDLCTTEEMKAKYTSVNSDKTFYAVFATAKTDEGEDDVTTTFDFTSGYENGTAIGTKTQDGVTITFGTGDNNSNKPTYYDSGNAVRVYAKNTITVACTGLTKITFTFGNDDGSNTITANTGSFTSPTWTGTANSVKFTIGGSSGNRRIQKVAVTYTATTSITTYSNYVTNCCNTPAPTNGTYTCVSGTEVQLKWNGSASRYHITCANPIIDDHTESTSYKVSSLTECEEYTFYVSAHPTDGCESEAIAITAQPFSGAKTVTFNPNGGSVLPTSETTSCTNQSIKLPTPTYSGYRFMGWFNAASGGTKIGEAGASYKPNADITLHAHWAKEYSVTYNANGGSTTCANGNYIEGETVTLCTSTPSKTGYTFAGWTYSPEVTITDGKFTMPASNITITAQWTINQYTVTWDPNGGNWGGSTANIEHTYQYGDPINRPSDPTRDGYRFIGWNKTIASTMPANNITYTAQWKQNYTITFHDGDDTTPWTQTIDAESIDLNTYVGTHACGEYNFAGWSTDATQYNDQTANITTWVTGTYTPTASIDLYAVYVKGDLATDFTLNCDGGVYEIWEKGHNQHMAGRQNGGGDKFYTTEYWDANNSESNGAPFTITKVADNTYTLQNADGQYITRDSYYEDELEIEETWENADRYKWTISNGTNGTWRFTNKAATSYALVYYDNRYFELRSASSVIAGNTTTYDLELTPAQTNVYQSNPNCGPYTITFETGGGEFIQGNYKYSTKKTSNLTEPTISQFPAAELDGYTFAGWKDGSPQEDINYEPYLKKADDNLVVSSNKTYHAVYYYYDEEEEIDWSEEFTTGMYADVNGTKYFLSGTPNRGTMSSTTDCGYVSEVTITPGTGENAGKYKITVNGVGMAPEAGETDLVAGTAWWTITETSAGSSEYKISGEDERNIMLLNSSFGHYAYNAQGSYDGNYYYPRFGKCLEHHWTSNPPIKLTVTYNPNGATSGTAPVDNNYYQIGGKVYVLGSNDLQKENYAFGGWNTQADGEGDNYEEGEDFTITGNTTLYAKWDCATYVNITKGTPVNGTFNLSVTGTQYTCEDGFVVSVTDIVPATGYRFDHITQEGVDAANVEINNADKTVTYKQLSNGSSTINVVFAAILYTVTWDPNGGNWGGSTNNKVETYNYGASITKPADPTRDGYTFAGWEPIVPATMPAEDQTFKAIWENCRWVETTTIEDGDEIVFIMVDNETSTSYAMDNKEETSSNPLAVVINTDIFSSGNVPNNIIWDIQKDANGIVFYSKTAADNYLRCNAKPNVRVGVGANNTFTLDEGYIQSLSYDDSYLAVATGANTKDWRQYGYSSNNITNQTLKLYKRICLDDTKHWVTWDANGGLFADGSTTQTTSLAVGATITHPANPTREGYTFTGWSPTTSTVGDEDITFVAQWQVNTYTVTWNANGGKFGNETSVKQSYPYGATITAPTPTRTGYTFAGWDSEVPATMPASDLTYNAQWNCTSPTDIKINGAYIVFPGETIELTVTGNNIADDATYQWFKKNGDSYDVLEEQTTNTLRIDNCVVGDAANYKCVVTNGTCSAENNFTVKMYRLRGLTDNTWNTEFVFSKDNADDKTAILHVDLAANTTYEFKLNDGSVWYWNEGTMTHINCTDWVIEQEGEDTQGKENTKITTTISGTYIFTLDYSNASKPKLSVIYPQKKIIYLDPDIWKANNAKFVVHAWTDGVDNGKDILMTRVDDCNKERIIYQAEIEASHDRIIFVRCNPEGFNINDIWSKEWNRTSTLWLTIPENQFNIEAWIGGGTEDGKTCSKGFWSDFIQFYTISYNMNGHGTQIADDCVEDGHAWDAPTDPTAVGYTFLGWRRPATTNDNTLYEYGQTGFTPTANEELTAQWSFSMEYAITGTANVTSAVGQTIKATTPLQLAVSNMPVGTIVAISAPNITFYDEAGNAITEVATKYNPEQFNLTIAYTPTVENTTEQPTITLSVLGNEKTFDGHISARSLPNTFAIVAKVGNLWYALPSQGLNSTDDLMGYAIEVDNQNDPTAVTAVPENADWSLRQVYAASHSDALKDRFKQYGANIMFENNASPAKMLNASVSDNYLLTNAEYDNYKQSDNQGLYEWTPTTTDLETYTLTNAGRTDKKLNVSVNTVFGVHTQNVATNSLRFLPIDERYTPLVLQVVEWKENSIVVMYNGDPEQTASVSVNGGAAQTTTLSAAQRDIAVYELTATGLADNPTQRLSITIGTEKLLLPIPYIVNSNTTDAALTSNNKTLAAVSDLVVLNGKTFTADAATASKYTFRNVTIYGGGKLVIPSEKGFGVASLTLRAGGITDAGEYDYVYPQFELRGTFTNSAAKINYDYITDYDHWFHLVLPFAGDLGTIKYPTEFYGANVAANNTGSWQIKRYAGEIRATGNYNAWVDIETEGETSTIAGQGYIFWGAPKNVTVNGETTRQKWGIQRITMSVKASDAETEKADKILTGLSSHEDVPNNSNKDNDQGWNLIGNPYMVNLKDMATAGLHACKLVEVIDPATGKWNGQWEWNDETDIRYLTIPSDHFDTYTAKTVEQSVPLVPGRAFFVQLEGEANAITFAAANRASLMPALLAENSDKPVDIETGIVLSNETLQDEVNFWIKDGKTNDYEYNADYPKTPNNNHFNIYGVHTNGDLSWVATGPEYAAESMPIGYQVPAAGTYMLSLTETYDSNYLEALYVTDHEMSPEVTTDLMITSYEFSVNQAETNNKRFTVAIKLKNGDNNDATGLDNLGIGNENLIKFIYQDKIYILHHGVIYDATGKRVITINK